MNRFTFGSVLCASTLVVPGTAYACIDIAKFEITDIRQADVIVSGELEDYEKVTVKDQGSLSDYAILTVKVRGWLKGKSAPTMRLSWDNSTFDEPNGMAIGAPVIVAGIDPNAAQPPLRGPSATMFAAPRTDMFRVLQAPCSGPFIFAASNELETDLRAILRGQDVKNVRYSVARSSLYLDKSNQTPSKPTWLIWSGIAVIVAVTFVLIGKSAHKKT